MCAYKNMHERLIAKLLMIVILGHDFNFLHNLTYGLVYQKKKKNLKKNKNLKKKGELTIILSYYPALIHFPYAKEAGFLNNLKTIEQKSPLNPWKSLFTFVPMTTCRSPGTKNEQSAYSQAIVRMHCSVDL